MPTFMVALLSCHPGMDGNSGSGDSEGAFRLNGDLRAAHEKDGRASYKGRDRRCQKNRRERPMQREHDAAKNRADDRSDPPNPQRPSHSRRANVSRIERGGQRVRPRLSANNSRAGKKSATHDGGDGMRVAEQGDANSSKKISNRHDTIRAEAISQAAKSEGSDDSSALKHGGSDDRKRKRNSSVVKS